MPSKKRDIVVIGGSAGGVDAVRALVARLPSYFEGALFLALHLGRRSPSYLGPLLARVSRLPVHTARDRAPIEPGKIYVAPPDRHMTLEPGVIRVAFGPLQDRQRPSIDVLFRSAALAYGPQVVGVVLTGFLSDGTAGLGEIKRRGGIAVVQDPASARHAEMPSNALRSVAVDHCLTLEAMPELLVRLSREEVAGSAPGAETAIARFEAGSDLGQVGEQRQVAEPSSFVCPNCGGALWELHEGPALRYRCRVGHGYSVDALVAGQGAEVERVLWAAIRSLEDRAALSQRLAAQWTGKRAPEVLDHFERQAAQCSADANKIRALLGIAASDARES